jgi:phosphatidylserine/phosphatidylglycerophosphate/cardiolipin synthase-like enzyme
LHFSTASGIPRTGSLWNGGLLVANFFSNVDWILIATGFVGGLTFVFYLRKLHRWLVKPPSIEYRFSPKGGCTDLIVRNIKSARREILVQGYSFTADPITYGLIDAKKRGVNVEILLDRSNDQDPHSDLHIFLEQGLKPLIDAKHAIAHNKIMIIDRKIVVTGSFNFTNQAEHENAENLLVIHSMPDVVNAYRDNFLHHKEHCQAANPTVASARGKRAA